MLIRPMEIVNDADRADTGRGVGGEHRLHVSQLADVDGYNGGMLVPSLADQSHGHAGQAGRLGPDDPVAVDKSDVRGSRFRDDRIGIDEQYVVEAVALRDAPAVQGTEQSDMFDVRHIATVDSRLEAQRRKGGLRNWSGCDQNVRLRVRAEMPELEGGVEHGHPDHHRPAGVGESVANEIPDTVGVQISIEYPPAVAHQAFQVERETAYPLVVNPHRGEVTIVGQSEGFNQVKPGCNAVQLHHNSQSCTPTHDDEDITI